ncbi:MAG: cytochrome c, partial [Planctomycetota bacterium]
PPLAGSEWVVNDEETVIRILLDGLVGPIVVRGEEYNGIMASWRHLGDERIAAVLTYIRASWGNDAPPISAEDVAALRAKGGNRPWTAERLVEARGGSE